MARKIAPRLSELPLYLAAPREEATQKIAERIKQGTDLRSRPMQSQPQFQDVQKLYWTWSEYNTEMLRRMFTTAKIADEYDSHAPFFVIRQTTLQEDVEELLTSIDGKIRTLASISARLELIPIAPDLARPAPQSKATASKKVLPDRDGSTMNKAALLTNLNKLLETKSIVEKSNPRSGAAQDWLASVQAHLEIADKSLAAQFGYYTSKIVLPLSSYTLGPLWITMQGLLRTAIARLELEAPTAQGKVYPPGGSYDVYRDLGTIIGAAKKDVFLIDPYADAEVFELYFERIPPGITIRLISKSPSFALKTVASKFSSKPGTKFEAKYTADAHDRVIFIDFRDCWVLGQSIKDAATKKPTYMIPVEAVTDMAKLYETIWQNASVYSNLK